MGVSFSLARCCLALLTGLLVSGNARGSTSLIDVEEIDGGFRFTTQWSPSNYYILEETPDLQNFGAIEIDLGENAPIWDVLIQPQLQPRAFYRVDPVSVFTPRDSDGDRIDDVYELHNPLILDPLNPDDANLDPDGNGRTHLQEYLARFGLGALSVIQAREVSIFNRGLAFAAYDVQSREFSTFNLGSPSASIEAFSRELTAFNGSGIAIADFPIVVSRELTSYNLGAPSASVEAISRQLSVYQGESPPLHTGYPQVQSREVSTFNGGAASASIEAVSREVSVNALKTAD